MKKTSLTRLLAILAAAALLLALTGCGAKEPAATDASLKKVLDSGRLVLGLDASFPPMGFMDGDEVVGFDIEVAQEVCDRLGVELVKRPIDWDEKEKLLNDGTIDCIWNGMSVNASRAAAMNLSDPYMKNEMIFVVAEDSTIKAMSQLKGRAVGVQEGSSAQELLEASELYEGLTVTLFGDNVALLNALAEGRLDAAFLDSVVAYYFIASGDRAFYVLPGNLGEEDYAIGFRKDDQALRDRIQEVIAGMNADGTLRKISVKWFGSDIISLKK